MKHKLQQIAIVALLSIALIGCGNEFKSTGTISGFAYLSDTIPWKRLPNSAGITVSIDNTNYSTQTDSVGHFALTGVKAGVYSISFSKNGYMSNKLVNKQFIGTGEYYTGSVLLIKSQMTN